MSAAPATAAPSAGAAGGSGGGAKLKELTPEQKAESLKFKDGGNKAFKAGEWGDAIKLYSQAIAIDNRNHVFFSNRSAAYLSQGAAASALSDARRVVTLKPEWPKGYSRLGAALFALKRYDESLDAYNQGLERAPDNDALKQGAEEARKARTPQATPARAADRDPAAAAGAGGGEGEGSKTQEDLDLEALLGIAEEVEQKKYMRPKEESQQPVVELGTQQEQIDRILQRNYKWINLNPFEVLLLTTDATQDEVKDRYRKLSALVHPDKSRDPRASAAFHEVKKAYLQLIDEKRCQLCVALVESAKSDVQEARRKQAKRLKMSVEELPESFDEAFKKETRKLFASIEHRRKKYEKGRAKQDMREREAQLDEEVKMREHYKHEKEWQKGREKRVGDWRNFTGDPVKKRRLGLDRGPKDTRQKEDLEFGKKHLTQAQLAEAKASSSKDTYKKQWR